MLKVDRVDMIEPILADAIFAAQSRCRSWSISAGVLQICPTVSASQSVHIVHAGHACPPCSQTIQVKHFLFRQIFLELLLLSSLQSIQWHSHKLWDFILGREMCRRVMTSSTNLITLLDHLFSDCLCLLQTLRLRRLLTGSFQITYLNSPSPGRPGEKLCL